MNSFINILFADDDDDDTYFLIEALKEVLSAFNSYMVTDGLALLRHLKTQEPPDLIFIDLNMPLKNGIECLKYIREQSALSNIPVIIYSTSYNIKEIDICYHAGARFYIVKPLTLKALVQLLEQLFFRLGQPLKDYRSKSSFVLMSDRKEGIL